MKENIEKKIETFVYGILSMTFGAAFFFGVLYPSQGISPNAYRVNETKSVYQGGHPCAINRRINIREKVGEYDKEDIHYTFYVYERLKNS